MRKNITKLLSVFLCIATVVAYSVPALAATETGTSGAAQVTDEQATDKEATKADTKSDSEVSSEKNSAAKADAVAESSTEESSAKSSTSSDNEVAAASDTTEDSDDANTTWSAGATDADKITCSLDEDGVMTVSGTGAMKDYAETEGDDTTFAPWNSCKSKITSVTFGEGITKIGKNTFNNCVNLTKIEIPSSDNSIEISEYAFYKCTSLKSVDLPSNVASLGYATFGDCESLETVTIHNDSITLANSVFLNITGAITIKCNPDSTASTYAKEQSITRECISDHEWKSEFETDKEANPFEDGQKSRHCKNCDAKTDVQAIPKTGSASGTFSCRGKTFTYTVDSTGLLTVSGTGDLDRTSTTPYPWESYQKYITKLVLKSGIQAICGFRYYENLKEIELPDTATNLYAMAFEGCSKLEQVTIPNSVNYVQTCAFHNCSNLKDVTVLNDDVSLDFNVFKGCSADLIIHCNPDSAAWNYAANKSYNYKRQCLKHTYGTYEIDSQATSDKEGSMHRTCQIEGCGYVETKTLPKGSHTETCGNLTWTLHSDGLLEIEGTGAMTYEDNNAPWLEAGYKDDIKKVEIENGITNIAVGAFYDCQKLVSISIPETVTSIDEAAFERCISLVDVTLPSSLTTIAKYAFSSCSSLEKITIPDSVTGIGESAFENASDLKEITIPDSVTEIGENAFNDDNDLLIICNPDSAAATYAKENNLDTKCITHTWSEDYTVDKEATCTEAGSESQHCIVCGASNSDTAKTIDPLGHKWSEEYTVDKEATCTETGSESQHCAVCGESNPDTVKSIKATGHTWKTYTQKAGYLKNGTTYSYCAKCGTKKNVKTLAGYSKYIVKKLKVKKGKKSFKVSWSKASKSNQKVISGYQIRYSKKSSMASSKYVKVGKTSKGKTIKNLSKKKKYYVQVRNYMTKGGKTYYSKWSAKKTVKTK